MTSYDDRSIVVDLDGTICFPTDSFDSYERYGLAEPNWPVILKLNVLKERGYYVYVHTARRMLTHDGNVEKVKEDVEEITKKWLHEHEVLYDELIFGKPWAMYYVDDKALLPEEFLTTEFS